MVGRHLSNTTGSRHEGKLVVRGVEIRRHDTPKFIKEFQTELLLTLFDCQDSEEIMLGGENIGQEDLMISKLLGQDLVKYKSLFPHVSADG